MNYQGGKLYGCSGFSDEFYFREKGLEIHSASLVLVSFYVWDSGLDAQKLGPRSLHGGYMRVESIWNPCKLKLINELMVSQAQKVSACSADTPTGNMILPFGVSEAFLARVALHLAIRSRSSYQDSRGSTVRSMLLLLDRMVELWSLKTR